MKDNKLTDKEIIEALEGWMMCLFAASEHFNLQMNREENLLQSAIALINRLKGDAIYYRRKVENQRQELNRLNEKVKDLKIVNEHLVTFNIEAKTEIERLQMENLILSQKRITLHERMELVNNARTKTIKECLEWVLSLFPEDKNFTTICRFTINQRLKEMVGDDE